MDPLKSMLPCPVSPGTAATRLEKSTGAQLQHFHRKVPSLTLPLLSSQLSFSNGDRLLVHTKPSPQWWWAELHGVIGYVPASHLRQDAAEDEEDTSEEDPWQDEEYFGSYGTLVRNNY